MNNEVVSVTFWEIPSSPLAYMKKQYYTGADAVIIGEDNVIGTTMCSMMLSWENTAQKTSFSCWGFFFIKGGRTECIMAGCS